MLKYKKGLTMIELIAAIIILGIISAISVPFLWNYFNNSDLEAKEIAETKMLTVVESYYQSNGSIPTTEHGMIQSQSFKNKCFLDIYTSSFTNVSKDICTLDTGALKKEGKLKQEVDDSVHYYVFYDGNKMRLSYDIPKELIEILAKEYKKIQGSYPIVNGSDNEINTKILSLPTKPVFKYILLENGTVDRLVQD